MKKVLFVITSLIAMFFSFLVGYHATASAKETTPWTRETEVVVTAAYYDDGYNYMYDLEERDGDHLITVYNPTTEMWESEVHQFSGNGDWWTVPYTSCDDATPGDVYSATVYTNGTETKDDDAIVLNKLIGVILPRNMQ